VLIYAGELIRAGDAPPARGDGAVHLEARPTSRKQTEQSTSRKAIFHELRTERDRATAKQIRRVAKGTLSGFFMEMDFGIGCVDSLRLWQKGAPRIAQPAISGIAILSDRTEAGFNGRRASRFRTGARLRSEQPPKQCDQLSISRRSR